MTRVRFHGMFYLPQCDLVQNLYMYTLNMQGSFLLIENAEHIPLTYTYPTPSPSMPGLAGCGVPAVVKPTGMRMQTASHVSLCLRLIQCVTLKKWKSEHLSPWVEEYGMRTTGSTATPPPPQATTAPPPPS